MSRLAVFFAEGYEEIEALTAVDICRRCGLEIDMVSVTEESAVKGAHGITVRTDGTISQICFDDYDMLILPGGMPGTRNLEANRELMGQVDAFFESGKYLAAICAAPSIFGHRGILKGKRACCFPGFESQLEGAEVTEGPVEIDGNVVTSRGMGTALDFALAVAGIFCGEDRAKAMAETVVYRR